MGKNIMAYYGYYLKKVKAVAEKVNQFQKSQMQKIYDIVT